MSGCGEPPCNGLGTCVNNSVCVGCDLTVPADEHCFWQVYETEMLISQIVFISSYSLAIPVFAWRLRQQWHAYLASKRTLITLIPVLIFVLFIGCVTFDNILQLDPAGHHFWTRRDRYILGALGALCFWLSAALLLRFFGMLQARWHAGTRKALRFLDVVAIGSSGCYALGTVILVSQPDPRPWEAFHYLASAVYVLGLLAMLIAFSAFINDALHGAAVASNAEYRAAVLRLRALLRLFYALLALGVPITLGSGFMGTTRSILVLVPAGLAHLIQLTAFLAVSFYMFRSNAHAHAHGHAEQQHRNNKATPPGLHVGVGSGGDLAAGAAIAPSTPGSPGSPNHNKLEDLQQAQLQSDVLRQQLKLQKLKQQQQGGSPASSDQPVVSSNGAGRDAAAPPPMSRTADPAVMPAGMGARPHKALGAIQLPAAGDLVFPISSNGKSGVGAAARGREASAIAFGEFSALPGMVNEPEPSSRSGYGGSVTGGGGAAAGASAFGVADQEASRFVSGQVAQPVSLVAAAGSAAAAPSIVVV